MTLYHFGNCLAIIYVPYYYAYKYSSLSEYGAFWKCIYIGIFYAVTQLCKLLLLATFFPESRIIESGPYDIIGEFLKYSVDLFDLVGIYGVMHTVPGRGHIKILTVSMGWAGAEIIFRRLLILWIGARSAAFDWKYIQSSLECNINMVGHMTVAALMWIHSRQDVKSKLILGLLILCVYKYYAIDLVVHYLMMGTWINLLLKAIVTFILSIISLGLYIEFLEVSGAN